MDKGYFRMTQVTKDQIRDAQSEFEKDCTVFEYEGEDPVFRVTLSHAQYKTVTSILQSALDAGGDAITGDTSDGYHTFNELYEHRHALFSALLRCYPTEAWKSRKHDDGSMFDGWFIAGIHTPEGNATYHIPMRLWDAFEAHEVGNAPAWDGHTPDDVIKRIQALTQPSTTGE